VGTQLASRAREVEVARAEERYEIGGRDSTK
jgi:hypothetical protein